MKDGAEDICDIAPISLIPCIMKIAAKMLSLHTKKISKTFPPSSMALGR
jgi:hypothetical protein